MKKIAIDFGSGVTKIYMPGCGVVLMESTCIAVEEYTERGEKKVGVKACGDKARALSGRAAVNTQIVNPVFEGDIIHEELAAHLLEYFLEKIEVTRRRAKHTEVMFILPCGCKSELKDKYQRIADACGICMTYFTLTPFAAVLGHNVSISETTPVFCVDIGYGITNIAALSQDGIIAGINVNLGGGKTTAAVTENLSASVTHDEYYYEVAEFISLVLEGRRQSAVNSHLNSLITMEIIDEIRRQTGVRFPADQPET